MDSGAPRRPSRSYGGFAVRVNPGGSGAAEVSECGLNVEESTEGSRVAMGTRRRLNLGFP